MFRGNKYIEWLFCMGKKLADEEIQNYLKLVNAKNCNELAEQLFGKDIVGKNIEEEIKHDSRISYKEEEGINAERNIATITITLSELEETEVEDNETE